MVNKFKQCCVQLWHCKKTLMHKITIINYTNALWLKFGQLLHKDFVKNFKVFSVSLVYACQLTVIQWTKRHICVWAQEKVKEVRQLGYGRVKVGRILVDSMIHSARPTVSPVADNVFAWNLCILKSGDGWTYVQSDMCKTNDHYQRLRPSGSILVESMHIFPRKAEIV